MYAHTHSFHSHGMPEYRCPREVSTALCIHDVECIEPNCSGHGSCNLGSCSCDPPWIGEGCKSLNCSLTDCSGHGSCTAEGTLMRVSELNRPTHQAWFPGAQQQSDKSAWYPLFAHAQAVPLHSQYNSLGYISGYQVLFSDFF